MSDLVVRDNAYVTLNSGLLDDENGIDCCCGEDCWWIFAKCACEMEPSCDQPCFYLACEVAPPDISVGKVYVTSSGCCVVAVEMTTDAADIIDCTNIGGLPNEYQSCEDCCIDTGETGACCDPDTGECTERTQAQCASQGGIWQGVGTDCGPPNPCPQPTLQPCCFEDGSCVELPSQMCMDQGGTPFGSIGDTCADVECPVNETCADCIPTECPDSYVGKLPAATTDFKPGSPPFGKYCDCEIPSTEGIPSGGGCMMPFFAPSPLCPDHPPNCECESPGGDWGANWSGPIVAGCSSGGSIEPFCTIPPEGTWYITAFIRIETGNEDIYCLWLKDGSCPNGVYPLVEVVDAVPHPPCFNQNPNNWCVIETVGNAEVV